MKVLYITGSCMTKNTSANMSHNAFVKGFLDSGAEVDVLMATDSWGEEDTGLPRIPGVCYVEYESQSTADKVRRFLKKADYSQAVPEETAFITNSSGNDRGQKIRHTLRQLAKGVFYFVFPQDPVYPLNKTWIKNAKQYRCSEVYDIVVSNSSPAASHRLAAELIRIGHISCERWVQIWEDPWFCDLYGGLDEKVKTEEHALLRLAKEIYYVSPLTLMYQKRFYSDCADAMKCVPLPFLDLSDASELDSCDKDVFGYFGDYYSSTRDLRPFYSALKETNFKGFIYGDTDLCFESNDKIVVHGRVTLEILKQIQNRCQVLVHLSNLRGGQIPGKIYHYSATDKPILFILDGTDEEKGLLREYFGQFNRYTFCDNTVESIQDAMARIMNGPRHFNPVSDFSPRKVVEMILKGESKEIV